VALAFFINPYLLEIARKQPVGFFSRPTIAQLEHLTPSPMLLSLLHMCLLPPPVILSIPITTIA
jgi:hypothetical protein